MKELYDYIDTLVEKYQLNEREHNILLKMINIETLKKQLLDKTISFD